MKGIGARNRVLAVGIMSVILVSLAASRAGASLVPPVEILLSWTSGPSWATNTNHTAFYDPHRHSMLVHNGGVTYELSLTDGSGWYGYPVASPAKIGPVVFDPLLRRFLIVNDPGGGAGLWQQMLGGTTISQISVGGTPPTGTGRIAFLDPVRRRVLYFTNSNTGWVVNLTGSPAWSPLSASGTPPTYVNKGNAVYDPVGDRLLVLEGMNDLMELPLSAPVWGHLAISGTGLGGEALAFDTRNNRIEFFGRSHFTCEPYPPCGTEWYNDTWAVTLTAPRQWLQLSANSGTGPHGRTYHSLMHDPINDRLVLYAGYWSALGQYYLNDTWFMDLGNFYASDLELDPAAVDFGSVTGPATFTATLDLSNVGTRPGVVYAIVSDDPTVTVDAPAFPIGAPETRTLTISWTPIQSGPLNATLEVESNDPDSPSILVPITGSAFLSNGADAEPTRPFALDLAGANPARGMARVALTMPARGSAEVAVFDLRGSLLRRLAAGELSAGRHTFEWDGADASGRPMGAGIYFVRAIHGGKSASVKLALAR